MLRGALLDLQPEAEDITPVSCSVPGGRFPVSASELAVLFPWIFSLTVQTSEAVQNQPHCCLPVPGGPPTLTLPPLQLFCDILALLHQEWDNTTQIKSLLQCSTGGFLLNLSQADQHKGNDLTNIEQFKYSFGQITR